MHHKENRKCNGGPPFISVACTLADYGSLKRVKCINYALGMEVKYDNFIVAKTLKIFIIYPFPFPNRPCLHCFPKRHISHRPDPHPLQVRRRSGGEILRDGRILLNNGQGVVGPAGQETREEEQGTNPLTYNVLRKFGS